MSNSNFGFLALALRQRLIKRWSLMHSVQPESVLEHSAVVTLLSYLAGNIAIQQGKSVDLAVMLAHASLHDAAEVLCSDVVTPVKKANAVLQREFERLEKAAEDKLIQTLPEELQDAVAIAFAPGGYEQSLVKACDTYSALMNPLMILVKIIKLRWIHILSYDQMVSRKINNQTTRCANSIF
ncbi:YfbR-like 5'-deoxynucleotidase, partial [Klebsiella pneumoniae]|uniref:YfbR-like 5'-deoxynucleotidase n=2 Tax=Klebsiella pneumoniae TaxID=573 RepID=UPI0024B3A686